MKPITKAEMEAALQNMGSASTTIFGFPIEDILLCSPERTPFNRWVYLGYEIARVRVEKGEEL